MCREPSIPVLRALARERPRHLGLFGYDPLRYVIGRGALEATGIGFALQAAMWPCAAILHCTLDQQGHIVDRRAQRIASEESAPIAIRLRNVKIPGVESLCGAGERTPLCGVFRGPGLGGQVADTDPQKTGVPPATRHRTSTTPVERRPKLRNSLSLRPFNFWPAKPKPMGSPCAARLTTRPAVVPRRLLP